MEKNLDVFLSQLASAAPTPGGGGASALVAALGVALANMVGSLTVGKEKYAEVQADIEAANEKAERLRGELLALVDADAAAFAPLAAAYAVPKDAPEREEIMEAALERAALPPLAIMQKCAEAMLLIAEYAKKGSALAVSDAGCAAALCGAAMKSAALNVFVNTKSMKNREKAAKLNAEADALLKNQGAMAEWIYGAVYGRLC